MAFPNSSQRPSSSLSIVYARGPDEKEDITLNSRITNAIRGAYPYLALKAIVPFSAMTTKWTDRSNHPPNQAHVDHLKLVYRAARVQKAEVENRMFLGEYDDDLRSFFMGEEDEECMAWDAKWRPDDDANPIYVELMWPLQYNRLVVISGQHRTIALQQFVLENSLP